MSSLPKYQGRALSEMASKIKPHHLQRKAILYVRQSTPYQVKNNQESGRLQRGLKEVVLQLGWSEGQVELIDEDQGRSASRRDGRTGFDRLLQEVDSGQVGLVMSLDVSRLSRSNHAWQILMWLCRNHGTLLGEQERLYDSNELSEELFLCIKGAMAAFEGRWLHKRMEMGKEAKAARGELGLPAARGYVLGEQGLLHKDADEQVRSRIELVLTQFERLGSILKVLRYFNEQGLLLPRRPRSGALKGHLCWRRPTAGALRSILHNPTYSGTYVYGRRQCEAGLRKPGRPYSGERQVAPEQCVLSAKLLALVI